MNQPEPLLPDEPLPQRISRILAWIAGAFVLFGCGLLITIDVVTRFFFKRGMVESFELSGYALAATIGLGLAFTVTSKSNIRVDVLLGMLPRPLRALCDILASLALATIAVMLAFHTWKTIAQTWSMGAKSVTVLQTPMILPQSIWWIGLFWFAAIAIIVPIQALLRLLRNDRDGFERLIGSLRVEEEIEQAGSAKARDAAPPTGGAA